MVELVIMDAREEKLYKKAACEVLARTVVPGLIAKAYSDANGDKDKTIAKYIRLRVEQLREELDEQESAARKQEREKTENADTPSNTSTLPADTRPLCGKCLYYYTEIGPVSLCKSFCVKHNRKTLSHWSCPDFTRQT